MNILKAIKHKIFPVRTPRDINLEVVGSSQPAISIGSETYINKSRVYCWREQLSLNIGSYCSIAEDVDFILGGEHDTGWISTFPFIERWNLRDHANIQTLKSRGSICIGHDVWIGHGAKILSGSSIGNGAIIAAGALVRGEVPPYSIVGGVPAKIIRTRFPVDLCRSLNESQWWLLPKESLRELVPLMSNPHLFLSKIRETNQP